MLPRSSRVSEIEFEHQRVHLLRYMHLIFSIYFFKSGSIYLVHIYKFFICSIAVGILNLCIIKELYPNFHPTLSVVICYHSSYLQAEFLEVSRFSFVSELGGKHCEGFVKKQHGGGRVFIGYKQCCVRYFLSWSKRWLILKVTS